MFLWLWKFLRGYVTIEVTGFSVERFMNMAAHKGIYLWNVVRSVNGVRMNVSIKGFRMLRECMLKTKCHIKIKERYGLPFVLYRYRKRKLLFAGLLLCLASVYALSCFVWLIDIQGANRIDQQQILAFCADQGLQIGAFKYKINNKSLKTALINHFHDISWINITVKGTRATIELVETLPETPVVDETTPCNVVAKKDGLITSIATSSGTPLKKQDDVVRKGEVMVSGELKATTDDGIPVDKLVHAYAEVWAKMYNTINLDVPFSYEEKEYTGRETTRYALIVFGKTLDTFDTPPEYTNYDRNIQRKQLNFGEDYPLPVTLVVDTYREFEPVTKTRTIEEAKELAGQIVEARMANELDPGAEILGKSVAYQETPEGLKVTALITTNERIDEDAPIEVATPAEPAATAAAP
jgi:similar to stage IV sporulation protein